MLASAATSPDGVWREVADRLLESYFPVQSESRTEDPRFATAVLTLTFGFGTTTAIFRRTQVGVAPIREKAEARRAGQGREELNHGAAERTLEPSKRFRTISGRSDAGSV